MIFPDSDEPDETGYVELTGSVVVPDGSNALVLLLLASGADPNGVVSYDDVKIYGSRKR